MLCFQKDRFFAWSGLIGLGLLVLFLGQSTARALSPLQTWRQQFFGTTNNTDIAADDADPDGDGLPNLLEYATGLDPTNASPDPIVFDTATGSLRVTLPKNTNAIDVAIAVEITTNLSDPLSWATNGTIIDQNTSSSLVVRDGTPIGALDARFMRVKFTDLGLVEPGIPGNFTLIPGAAKVTLSWSAPAANGGAPIDFYSIMILKNGTPISSTIASPSATNAVLSGLTTANYPSGTIGQVYSFQLSAHNVIGYGAAASGSATPKVSYNADNLPAIFTKSYASGSCVNCHSAGLPPILSGGAAYTSVVGEGTKIYQVPANLVSGHHTGITTFSSSSFEYQTLQRWVSDGSLQ